MQVVLIDGCLHCGHCGSFMQYTFVQQKGDQLTVYCANEPVCPQAGKRCKPPGIFELQPLDA